MKLKFKLSFKRHHRQSLYPHAFHVYRDWSTLLVMVVVLSAMSVLVHAYLFYNAQAEPAVILGEPTNQLTVKRDELKQTIDLYTNRRTNFDAKKQESAGVVDPSL